MSEWLPIDTAPKDGTNIILSNGKDVAQGWYSDEPGYIREHRDSEGAYLGQDESDGYTGWMDCDGGMQPDPTHWQPLPPPPMVAEEAAVTTGHGIGYAIENWVCYGMPTVPLSPAQRTAIREYAQGFEECTASHDELVDMADHDLIRAAYQAMAEYARGQM